MHRFVRSRLLDRLEAVLVCPEHRKPLRHSGLNCPECGRAPTRTATRIDFGGLSDEAQASDWLNRTKAAAKKRLGRFYPRAIQALAPVYGDTRVAQFLDGFDLEQDLVADLGAGTASYDDRVVCVDGYGYDTVHLVADLSKLPLADGSLAGVISQAVLEHVPDPAAHVAEMFRVLRPGGRLVCFFPFMQGFHASPHDYSRVTQPGLRKLFDAFDIDDVYVAGGPTSGLVWTLQEWLAIAGSFGSERLYRALVPLTWVLSPLKYLDAVLINHPAAHVIASGFGITATKRA